MSSPHHKVLMWLMPLLLLHAAHLHLALLALWILVWATWNHSISRFWRLVARPAVLMLMVVAAAWVGPPKSVEFQVSILFLLSAVLFSKQLGTKAVVNGMALTVTVFLIGSLFLLTQDLVVLFLACLWLILFLMVSVVVNFGVSLAELRLRASVLAWVTGLSSLAAAIIFLLIPRIPIGLAGPIGFDQVRATSGVSSRLSPSDLGPVTLNSAADYAVRVIDGALPQQPYWRVYTLNQFSGGQWSAGPSAESTGGAGGGLLQEVTEQGVRYSVQSLRQLDQPLPRLSASSSNPALGGPILSPTLWSWAQSDRLRYASDAAWIDSLLQSFRRDYRYNLNASVSSAPDPLAEFFFSTRQGYCSHFAASLAEMLRANGIPVQLVTGYLGVDYNASGDFHTLRQSQAHVWLEARLDGTPDLVRIDPTMGVMPSPGSLSPQLIQQGFLWASQDQPAWRSWATLQSWRYRIEACRINVSRAFMAIGYERQQPSTGGITDLFERLTGEHLGMVLGFFSLCFLAVALLVWRSSITQGGTSMTNELVQRLARLSRQRESLSSGMEQSPGEGRLDFVRRWARAHGQSPHRLECLAASCLRFDYGPPLGGQRANRRRWQRLLRRRIQALSV